MNLLTVGCSFRNTPVALRERLAFAEAALPTVLGELSARYGCEAALLSTCNRVEIYLARATGGETPGAELIGEFLAESRAIKPGELAPLLYEHRRADAVRHLFRVASSLDSLIVGEAQVSGQVKRAYEIARQCGSAGPVLHALFQHARVTARRVRKETGLSTGHASVSSAAVDYVRQVFEHFGDKTVLVIGAGKMGGLTLRHLRRLQPRRIQVTNRSPEKAVAMAAQCGGVPVPWDQLDDALVEADIILSTTGAPEPVVTRQRYTKVLARRRSATVVILDIAVPRDFDPEIHDGERTCLFNIDDLNRIREQTLKERLKHISPAEAIVAEEQQRFLREWDRRHNGPLIARLTDDFEAKRQAIVKQLMGRLNGKLSDGERDYIEGAFRLLQNQILHGPIRALAEESHEGGGHTLREALRKLFRLED